MAIQITAIRSKIGKRFQYTASLSFGFIKKHIYLVDDSKETMQKMSERGLSTTELAHRQRKTDLKRGGKIARDIKQGDFFLPSIICIFKNGIFVPDSAVNDDYPHPVTGTLHISDNAGDFFYSADGQHRISGIQLVEDDDHNHINATLVASCGECGDRQLSVDININAKRYDKSLARTMCSKSILNIMVKQILDDNQPFKTLVNCSSNSVKANNWYFYNMESVANFVMIATGLTENEIQDLKLTDRKYIQCQRAISKFIQLLSTDFSLLKTAIKAKSDNDFELFKKEHDSTILKTSLFLSSLGLLCYIWITDSILQNKVNNEIAKNLNGIDIGFHYDLVSRAYDINYKMLRRSKSSINLTTAFILKHLKIDLPQEIMESELNLKQSQMALKEMVIAKNEDIKA